jgi:hypothetical protein
MIKDPLLIRQLADATTVQPTLLSSSPKNIFKILSKTDFYYFRNEPVNFTYGCKLPI